MKLFFALGVIASITVGCTNLSDREVIEGYRRSESQKQLAIDNSVKMTKDQMLLNAAQRLRAVIKDPNEAEKAVVVLQMVWLARNEVETVREQYTMARILTMVTVGNYLYDKQGAFNVIIESLSDDIKRVSGAANSANAAVGVKSVRDILNPPSTRPVGNAADAQRRVETQMDRFNNAMDQVR